MIFSTVFGPHEPAFTVGSLAITATGRPATAAMPVTTPSAPKPSFSQLASSASSANEPVVHQPRDALAHGQLALLLGLLVVALRARRRGRARGRRTGRVMGRGSIRRRSSLVGRGGARAIGLRAGPSRRSATTSSQPVTSSRSERPADQRRAVLGRRAGQSRRTQAGSATPRYAGPRRASRPPCRRSAPPRRRAAPAPSRFRPRRRRQRSPTMPWRLSNPNVSAMPEKRHARGVRPSHSPMAAPSVSAPISRVGGEPRWP